MHPMIEAFRETAAHRLDPPFWQYVQRGCGMGISVAEAESSWAAYRLRPRTLRDVSTVDLGLDLFGTWSNPVGVAPTAFHKLTHAEGEIATAGAAGAVGSPFVLSSRSTCRIEDVGAAVRGPWWFQVYMTLTREVTEGMVRRAVATGATALVLTVDTPYVGHRNIPDSGRPMEMTDELALVNMGDHLTPQQARAPWSHIDQDPAIGVETIEWLKQISGRPVVVKGVLREDDARLFVDHGADAVWVSAHGGRQLDRAVTPASVLPEIVEAVGDSVPVAVDGGVRDGFDILTALGLGASAVFVGRPALWALASQGRPGVESLLLEYAAELKHVMGLAGVTDLQQIRDACLVR